MRVYRHFLVVFSCAVLAVPGLAAAAPILEVNGAGKTVGANGLGRPDFITAPDDGSTTPEGLILQIGLGTFERQGLVFRVGSFPGALTAAELLGENTLPSAGFSAGAENRAMIPNPEPASLVLLGSGLAGVVAMTRRSRHRHRFVSAVGSVAGAVLRISRSHRHARPTSSPKGS